MIKTQLVACLERMDSVFPYYVFNYYIVNVKDNKLSYAQAAVSKFSIKSYDLNLDIIQKLTKISEESLPAAILEYYKKKRTKGDSISDLCNDDTIAKHVQTKIENLFDRAIQFIIENDIPIISEFKRNEELENYRLFYDTEPFDAKAKFIKTDKGIEYLLMLKRDNKEYRIQTENIKILTDGNKYFIYQNKIAQLKNIQAAKLKPFINKDIVQIPVNSISTYLNGFVKEMMTKIEVETEGFDLQINQTSLVPVILFTENVFKQKWTIELSFQYNEINFRYWDAVEQKVVLVTDSKNQTGFQLTKRDRRKEQEYVDQLIEYGFIENEAGRFEHSINSTKYGVISSIALIQQELQDKNWKIQEIELEKHKLALLPYSLKLNFEAQTDWFDVQAEIEVGLQKIPFAKFIPYIKKQEHFYPLGQGKYFLIPKEWMTNYSELAQFSHVDNDQVTLLKSNYKVIEPFLEGNTRHYEHIVKDFDFNVSPMLKAELRPYQIEGAKWLILHQINHLGACLADDMGLGKTVQTISSLLYFKDQQKEINSENSTIHALLILPSSLVFNWEAEINKFAPELKIYSYVGSKRNADELLAFDIVLSSYHIVSRDLEILKSVHWNFIVLDEAHYIKNRNSKVYQSLSQLNGVHKISLSGTPIENSLSDLYTQMHFINPQSLGSESFFKKNFQQPIEKEKNESQLKRLREIVEPFLLRRTRSEVLPDLPELEEQIFYCTMSENQNSIYEETKSFVRNQILQIVDQLNSEKLKVINMLMKLRQIANHPLLIDKNTESDSGKFTDVCNAIDNIVQTRQKVLIFSSFTSHIQLYLQYCKDNGYLYSLLTGETATKQRAQEVNQFQKNPDCHLFFISLKAGGVGLNLTSAQYVFILDPWWNPFAEQQAIARAHRMGQQNKVSVIRYISKNSIEEKILHLQQRKKQLSQQLLDSETEIELNEEEIMEMIL